MKLNKVIIFLFIFLVSVSCTDNSQARNWGGEETIDLKSNEILINITWKEDNLWILTQDTSSKEFFFREHSSFGIWEGTILFK